MAAKSAPEKKRLVTGNGDPDAPYAKIPPKKTFEELDADFVEAPDLQEIIDALLLTHESLFGPLAELEIKALWKAEGGTKSGNMTLGKCMKLSGLARYFGDCDFVIWLAADWLRELNAGEPATALQVEGMCFHELKHCATTDKGAIVLGYKGHETRSWRTSYRGLVAIHAAKGVSRAAKEFTEEEIAIGRLSLPIPLGAVLCIVELKDCRPTEDVALEVSALERRYGDYSPGRWAWTLELRRVFDPIPARGALGLWEWSLPDVVTFRPRGTDNRLVSE